jgi:hypothetical protein
MPMYRLIHVGYRGPEKFPDFEFQGGGRGQQSEAIIWKQIKAEEHSQ